MNSVVVLYVAYVVWMDRCYHNKGRLLIEWYEYLYNLYKGKFHFGDMNK